MNFRIDKWTSPTDPGFVAAYDSIVDAITSQGMAASGDGGSGVRVSVKRMRP